MELCYYLVTNYLSGALHSAIVSLQQRPGQTGVLTVISFFQSPLTSNFLEVYIKTYDELKKEFKSEIGERGKQSEESNPFNLIMCFLYEADFPWGLDTGGVWDI